MRYALCLVFTSIAEHRTPNSYLSVSLCAMRSALCGASNQFSTLINARDSGPLQLKEKEEIRKS
jgi:hypothetical protein